MNPLVHLARFGSGFGYHPGFGHAMGAHAYGYHPAFGGGIGHMILSAVVHGMIYSAIFRLFSHMSLGTILLIVAVVIGALYVMNRNNGYRRW